jgi:type I restriction enzyme, S subunit
MPAFGEFAAPMSLQGLKLERQIENLRRTRDLLLPRLLSGQLEVEAA